MTKLSAVPLLVFAATAWAVSPAVWHHATEADFAAGDLNGVVVTSLGELRVARAMEIIVPVDKAPAAVSTLAAAGKTIYAAAASECAVWRIAGGKVEKLAEPPGTMVAALVWADGALLAGTCGDEAGIYRLGADGAVKRLWADGAVRYVWAILPGEGNVLYAATGPEGKVFQIDPAGKAKVVYHAGKLAKNILCLAHGPGGTLYAGTDENGLVVAIDPAAGTGRVILDADEREVSALIADGGGLFAATADAARAVGDGKAPPSDAQAGKADRASAQPEGDGPAVPETQPATPTTVPAPAERSPSTRPAARAGATAGPPRPHAGPPSGPPSAPGPSAGLSGPGNAVYHIRPDGMVETLFRRPVTVLAMLRVGDRLILGTGNGGVLYSVSTDGDEIAQLADTEAKQVTALAAGEAGRIVFGTANEGSVGAIGPGLAEKGTFTTKALDAKQIAGWGTIRVQAAVPAGTKLTVATRSGNVGEPDDKTWGAWSKELPVTRGFLRISSPAGRYLQYRLTLTPGRDAGPVVHEVQLIYQVGNLAPVVSGVTVQPSARGAEGRSSSNKEEGQKAFRHVAIAAADPNGDELTFTIEFREVGTAPWITIASALGEPKYVWDTRTVGDGLYELRATASDSRANPPGAALSAARISNRVVIDNTAPKVELTADLRGGKVTVAGTATDAGSRIVRLWYAVDSADKWVAVLPGDGICDAGSETFRFELEELAKGAHRIAVKAEDLFGNEGYAAATVAIE